VTDPTTTAIAAAVATQAVSGLSEAGKAALKAVVRLIRRKLSTDEESASALAQAQAEPADDARVRGLAAALHRAIEDDQRFAEELYGRWQDLQQCMLVAGQDHVVNTVSGDIRGNLVQARDIRGGISFGRSYDQ
jgi:hypothetical protein